MKKTFDKIVKSKTVSPQDLGVLLKYIHSPENKGNYYLTNEIKEDKIGKYRVLVTFPNDPEKKVTTKLYEKDNDPDLVEYKIQYYDILREEISDTTKAMQLYALQKNIEYVFGKELKIHEQTGEFEALYTLLEKVKKARAYYSFKMFLGSNQSKKHMVTKNGRRRRRAEASPEQSVVETSEQEIG